MRPGRNDPCPCGSGRKYKRCCAAADARRDRTLTLLGGNRDERTRRQPTGPSVRELLRAAPEGIPWETPLEDRGGHSPCDLVMRERDEKGGH